VDQVSFDDREEDRVRLIAERARNIEES